MRQTGLKMRQETGKPHNETSKKEELYVSFLKFIRQAKEWEMSLQCGCYGSRCPDSYFRYGGEAGKKESGCRERALFQIEA